jgi:hypothetical protein
MMFNYIFDTIGILTDTDGSKVLEAEQKQQKLMLMGPFCWGILSAIYASFSSSTPLAKLVSWTSPYPSRTTF